MHQRKDLSWKEFVFLFIALIVLLMLATSLLYVGQAEDEAVSWIQHAQKVMQTSQKFLSVAQDMETGVRGYLLTESKVFLQPYQKSLVTLHSVKEELSQLARNDIQQQNSIEYLDKDIAAITVINSKFLKRGGTIEDLKKQKAAMDTLRKHVDEIQKRETLLLVDKANKAKAAWLLKWTFRIGLLIGTAIAVISGIITLRKVLITNAKYTEALEQEIEARKLASESLKRSEDMFALTIDAVKDYAIFLLSSQGHVLTWNKGAEAINGYKASEIIGQHFSIFYPEDIPKDIHSKELEIAVKEGQYKEEGWRIRKDGSRFLADVTISPVFNQDKNLTGFVKVTRDLTERIKAQTDLANYAKNMKEARDVAISANQLKSQFLANVSHEIRTPMAGILGLAELLTMEKLTKDGKMMAENLFSSAKNLLTIVNDLLNFSKLEAGKVILDNVPFNVNEIVDYVFNNVSIEAKKKHLLLEKHIDTTIPATIVGDATKIQQCLLNLVQNAVKFTSTGRVTVSAMVQEISPNLLNLTFSVEDTGIGIPANFQKHLFQPFVQADGSMTRKYGGSGLGLSIVKKSIELMKGELEVSSEEGKGSRFWFSIPVQVAVNKVGQPK